MNKLLVKLNYSAYEVTAKYLGEGTLLEPIRYREPFASTDSHPTGEFVYGPDPVLALTENWVQLGRLVSYNGKQAFLFIEGNYVVNGTHAAQVRKPSRGPYAGQLMVYQRSIRPMEYLEQQLLQNAHNKRLTTEELLALNEEHTHDQKAKQLEASIVGGYRSLVKGQYKQAFEAFQRAKKQFNSLTERWGLANKYQVRVTKKERKNGQIEVSFMIGKETTETCQVINSKNQTVTQKRVFEETIKYLPQKEQFVLVEGYQRLTWGDRQPKDFVELLEYLEETAEEQNKGKPRKVKPNDWKNEQEEDTNKDQTKDGETAQSAAALLPVINDPYHLESAFEPGDINQLNYNLWDEGLLAVAVIIDHTEPSSQLSNVLAQAIGEDVYGYLDQFSFGPDDQSNSWKNLLLNESDPQIRYYDVIFVDDYTVDDWEESWSLTPREKQILAEWLYNGGSLYLSSAITDEASTSIVKDKFFPADYLTMRTSNVLLGGGFNVNVNGTWNIQTDTPQAVPYQVGAFAYNDTTRGLIPGSLYMGIINQRENGQWVYDCPSETLEVAINQTISVPETFAKAYFSLDYQKLTALDSELSGSRYEIRITS
jgi:hypothetical protein